MTRPNFQALGNSSGVGAGIPTPTMPAHVADDFAILYHETQNESPSTPATWTALTPTSARADTQASLSYQVATSGAMGNPALSAATNHAYARIGTYRNVDLTDPFVLRFTAQRGSDTTGYAGGFYCPVGGVLVTIAIAFAGDIATLGVGSVTNASLSNITIQFDEGTTNGNGGGIALITGECDQGVIEPTTWTQTASATAVTVTVLRPNAEIVCTGTVTVSGSAAPNGSDVVTIINLTQPADPPITGIDLSSGNGTWTSAVRTAGHTYQAIYRSATAFGASDDSVES